jgi:hypothetical protein
MVICSGCITWVLYHFIGWQNKKGNRFLNISTAAAAAELFINIPALSFGHNKNYFHPI